MQPAATAPAHPGRATYRRAFDRPLESQADRADAALYALSLEVGTACAKWLLARGIRPESWKDMLAREYAEHRQDRH